MNNMPAQRTWLSPRTTEHYNYRRDAEFMTEERVPNVSTTGMPTEADIAKNNGVPPIAIPYMALQNLNRPDGTGKRIIVPMVTGFESTFLANSLQGLLCLPGCESVFMGEPVSTTAAAQKEEEAMMMMNANEEEAGGMSLDDGDGPSMRSSSSPVPPPTAADRAASPGSGTSSPRSPSSNGSDINSLGPSGELDAMTTEEAGESLQHGHGRVLRGADGCLTCDGVPVGNQATASADRKAARVLRGGIRCHGSVRIKTAVSRTYADFVLQHLEDGEIQLKTPAPRSTSAEAVSDRQLDDAGELETLRGQTPNVPRCLAPVALPEERRENSVWRTGMASQDSNGGLSSSPLSPQHAHPTAALHTGDAAAVSVVAKLNDPTAKMAPTTSEHSCSDNSPTPSSGDGDEAEGPSSEEGSSKEGGEASRHAHHHAHSASAHALAGTEMRVGLPVTAAAQDGRRFTCFASNSVENMPEYHFPRLESDDLVELTAFMVVRSSVQPDEAVDLNLATHILGDPQSVARMPYEARNALINRAARLMEAAVFLQI